MPPKTLFLKVSQVKRESATCSTISLSPEKGGKIPAFLPGQFANLYLRLGTEEKETCRSYTIASAPGEKSLRFAFRTKGDFTKSLWTARKGKRIRALLPLGKFLILPADAKKSPVILIGGGIGIAGFLSAVRLFSEKGIRRPKVFYSSREHDDTPFVEELAEKSELVLTLTGENLPIDWTGAKGRIDKKLLSENLSKEERSAGVFYVCGSNSFVKAIHKALLGIGIPGRRIREEGFG